MKNIYFIACLISLTALASSAYGKGTKIHAVLVIDTKDKSIGSKYDLQNVKKELKTIAKHTKMKLKLKVITKKKWSRKNVMNAVKRIRAQKNDMLFFYYSGHGYRFQSKNVKWPSMILKNDKGLDLYWVFKEFRKKKPRFMMVISDSCNNIVPEDSFPSVSSSRDKTIIKENYKKLFLKSRGSIIASGCVPGQFSYGGPPDGGMYTNALRKAIKRGVKLKHPSWRAIMERANRPLYGGKQQPQYELMSVDEKNTSVIDNTNIENNESPEPINNNTIDYDSTNAADPEICRESLETYGLMNRAYDQLNKMKKIKKKSRLYKDLLKFFKDQRQYSKEDKDTEAAKDFNRYMNYMKKNKWKRVKYLVEGYREDWKTYLKEDCRENPKE